MKNVLIVGCGKIAGLYEEKKSKSVFSHAKAIKNNNYFNLKYCVDNKKKHLIKFKKKWDVKNYYLYLDDIKKEQKIDLIIVCTSTQSHEKVLEKCYKLRPKVILCEKPLSNDIKTVKKIIKKKPKKTLLFINYQRRLNLRYKELKEKIRQKSFGELRSITAIYNKGLRNNGSHLIDLLFYLLGKVKFVNSGHSIKDYNLNDLNYPFLLKKNKTSISVNIGNSNDYYIFYIKFVFSNKVIEFTENEKRINYFRCKKTKNYNNFSDLYFEKTISNKKNISMDCIYKELENFFRFKKKIFITNYKQELYNQLLIEQIINNKING